MERHSHIEAEVIILLGEASVTIEHQGIYLAAGLASSYGCRCRVMGSLY